MTLPPACNPNTGTWRPTQQPGSYRSIVNQPLQPGNQTPASASTAEGVAQIADTIRHKYAQVSISAQGKFRYPTGRAGALALRYDQRLFHDLTDDTLDSFCGVGNPFAIEPIAAGSTVLDVGCGAGFDLIIAARTVGEAGRICGIDLTPEMLARAQKTIQHTGITTIETIQGRSERIPYPSNTFDVVISNGVINLSPHKVETFQEIYRVCKPGGRLQFADIVLTRDLPQDMANSPEAWSQWIGGAISVGDQLALLKKAGFLAIEHCGGSGFATSAYTLAAEFKAIAGE